METTITKSNGEFNLESLISQGIEKNMSVDTMERLLAMRKEIKAEFAKEKFIESMAKFQSECPVIIKTKEVRTKGGIVAYRYAPIESIVEQVKPFLKENGFSYSTNMVVLPDGVKVSCIVTHILGHTQESEMQVPLGQKTDIMSASQVTAAASTFAKRYAFCNAFGIMTGDEDVDGNTEGEKEFDPETSTIGFGKYKGKTYLEISKIDKGYLDWMIGSDKTSPEEKEKLKKLSDWLIDRPVAKVAPASPKPIETAKQTAIPKEVMEKIIILDDAKDDLELGGWLMGLDESVKKNENFREAVAKKYSEIAISKETNNIIMLCKNVMELQKFYEDNKFLHSNAQFNKIVSNQKKVLVAPSSKQK